MEAITDYLRRESLGANPAFDDAIISARERLIKRAFTFELLWLGVVGIIVVVLLLSRLEDLGLVAVFIAVLVLGMLRLTHLGVGVINLLADEEVLVDNAAVERELRRMFLAQPNVLAALRQEAREPFSPDVVLGDDGELIDLAEEEQTSSAGPHGASRNADPML